MKKKSDLGMDEELARAARDVKAPKVKYGRPTGLTVEETNWRDRSRALLRQRRRERLRGTPGHENTRS